MNDFKKVAIVYDRVNKWGGAERMLLSLNKIFPKATLFTLVYDEAGAPWAKKFKKVNPSFLQKIPLAKKYHQALSTLAPIAFEKLDFNGFDLVISVTSEAGKGIITTPPTLHLSLILTPTRYLWSGHDFYFKNPLLWFFSRPSVWYLKKWERVASQRPDRLVAISKEVKKRIKKYYKRESLLIYPPHSFTPGLGKKKKDFFLLVGRIVPYKRVDLVVEAFSELGKPLIIVGKGSALPFLKLKAKKNIKFLGEVDEKGLTTLYQEAKALIMPQEEDFGLVSLEAQSAGTPVIAYGKGGAAETVIPGKTGILFNTQTKEALKKAIREFEKKKFESKTLRANAASFSEEKFIKEIKKTLDGMKNQFLL